LLVQKTLV